MSFSNTLLVVLCCAHHSVQLQAVEDVGEITQMTSASYKKIEVEEASWMLASWNETNTYLADNIKWYVVLKYTANAFYLK